MTKFKNKKTQPWTLQRKCFYQNLVHTEKCNIAEAQYMGFKMAIMNMFNDLKEDMTNEEMKKH